MQFFKNMRPLNRVMLYFAIATVSILAVCYLVNYIPASKMVLETHRKELSKPNPTSYIFDFPLQTIRDSIFRNFQKYRFMSMSHARSADTYELRRDGLIHDLIFVSEGLRSYIYWKEDKAYYYKFRLHLHFDSLAPSRTKLSIITHKAKIKSGEYWIISSTGHMGLELADICQPVEPSTIEEYQLLYNIGRMMGVNMPPVIFPEELTEEQIWATFFSMDNCKKIKSPFIPGNK